MIPTHAFSFTLASIMHCSLNARAFLLSKTMQQPYLRDETAELRFSRRLSAPLYWNPLLFSPVHTWEDQPQLADISGHPQGEVSPLILPTTVERKLLECFILGVLTKLSEHRSKTIDWRKITSSSTGCCSFHSYFHQLMLRISWIIWPKWGGGAQGTRAWKLSRNQNKI